MGRGGCETRPGHGNTQHNTTQLPLKGVPEMHRIPASELVNGDGQGNWVHEFRYRGRTYTMVPGGPVTFGDTWLKVRVWRSNAPGARDLKLQDNMPVDVLTYRSPLMGSVLDGGGYAPIPAEPDAADLEREAL